MWTTVPVNTSGSSVSSGVVVGVSSVVPVVVVGGGAEAGAGAIGAIDVGKPGPLEVGPDALGPAALATGAPSGGVVEVWVFPPGEVSLSWGGAVTTIGEVPSVVSIPGPI